MRSFVIGALIVAVGVSAGCAATTVAGKRRVLPGDVMRRTSAPDTKLAGADLSNVVLSRSNLHGADLAGATLEYASFYRTDLGEADLTGAQVYRANLFGADLRGAKLEGADLSQADLRMARLQDARLKGTDLRGAFLQRADLRETDLTQTDLTGAVFDAYTILPETLDPFEAGMVYWRIDERARRVDRKPNAQFRRF